MTFIGWKAAGTLHPMSRPISTSERCCLLSAIWDRCFHWLAWRYVCNILMWSGVVFSWVCKRDFGWCIFIFLKSWMDGSITFLVLIEFVPTTLLTCRSTSGVSTSSCSSKASARVWARIWSLGGQFPHNFREGNYVFELPLNLVAILSSGQKWVKRCDVSVKTFMCSFCWFCFTCATELKTLLCHSCRMCFRCFAILRGC